MRNNPAGARNVTKDAASANTIHVEVSLAFSGEKNSDRHHVERNSNSRNHSRLRSNYKLKRLYLQAIDKCRDARGTETIINIDDRNVWGTGI